MAPETTANIVLGPPIPSNEITIGADGIYAIHWEATVQGASSFFALFLNGTQIPGSDYRVQSGNDENNGRVIVSLNEEDVLTMRFIGTVSRDIDGLGGVSASLLITKLN